MKMINENILTFNFFKTFRAISFVSSFVKLY